MGFSAYVKSVFAAVGMLAAIASASGALADDWRLVALNGDNGFALDVDSIRDDGPYRFVNAMHGLARSEANGIDYFVMAMEFQCSNRTHNVSLIQGFRADGRLVASESFGSITDAVPLEVDASGPPPIIVSMFRPAPPGSIQERMLEYICYGTGNISDLSSATPTRFLLAIRNMPPRAQ